MRLGMQEWGAGQSSYNNPAAIPARIVSLWLFKKCLEASGWKRGGLQLALSMQSGALEHATFLWAGASALLWIVCNRVHASGLRSLGRFQCLSLLERTGQNGVKSFLAV